jgi:DNA-binding NarL/FixJ family response regulator
MKESNLLKILIVEDEAIVATDLAETLTVLGYKVIDTVDSAKGAHLSIKNNRPDLILMDVCIKGEIDGIELALEVFERYNIPVVHLTAFSDNETINKIKKTQSYGYLSKPYDEKELYIAIELAVSKHRILNNSKSLYMLYLVALEQMEGGIIIADLEKRVLLINSTVRTMLDISLYDFSDYFVSNILEKGENQKYFLLIKGKVEPSLVFKEVELFDSHGKKKGYIYKSEK